MKKICIKCLGLKRSTIVIIVIIITIREGESAVEISRKVELVPQCGKAESPKAEKFLADHQFPQQSCLFLAVQLWINNACVCMYEVLSLLTVKQYPRVFPVLNTDPSLMHNQVPNVKAAMGVFRVRERNTDERERGGEPSIVGNMRLSRQGAPSRREEVLGKISPRQDPHIAVLQGIALDHKVYLGELCMWYVFSGLHQSSRAHY